MMAADAVDGHDGSGSDGVKSDVGQIGVGPGGNSQIQEHVEETGQDRSPADSGW